MPDINQVQLPDGSQYNIKDDVSGYATETYVQNQIGAITKATIGLGNVNNTSDADKPVSTAQQTALNAKTDNSTIAYVESSTTATKRYEIGDQFILNGVLYKATSIIANAGTIEVGTNCTASDPVATQIDTVKGAVNAKANKTDLTSISETGSTASQAISAGTYFYLDGVLVRAKTAIASGATFTLNTNYEVVADGALNDVASIYNQNSAVLLTLFYSAVSGYSGAMIPFLLKGKTVSITAVTDITTTSTTIPISSVQLIDGGAIGYIDGSYIVQIPGNGYNGHTLIVVLSITD